MIRLAVDPGRYAPGEEVRGTVTVTESGAARSLLIAVRCIEQSPDYAEAVTDIPSARLAEGDLTGGSGYAFALRLPDDALPSVRSAHGRIFWEAVAWVDRSGRDPQARAEFEVASSPMPSAGEGRLGP